MEWSEPVANKSGATLSCSLLCNMAAPSHSYKMLHFHKAQCNLSQRGEEEKKNNPQHNSVNYIRLKINVYHEAIILMESVG